MIGRLWTTQVDVARAEDYESFARDISLPMFRRQQGFRGTIMLRQEDRCAVLTLWRDIEDVVALRTSKDYKATVRKITAQGFLPGEQAVDVYKIHLLEFA